MYCATKGVKAISDLSLGDVVHYRPDEDYECEAHDSYVVMGFNKGHDEAVLYRPWWHKWALQNYPDALEEFDPSDDGWMLRPEYLQYIHYADAEGMAAFYEELSE
jgi:hypothetical protein